MADVWFTPRLATMSDDGRTGPRFTPFRAWRYAPGTDLQAVIGPPYDVLSDADAARLRTRHPHHIVHVDVPASVAGGLEVVDEGAGRVLPHERTTPKDSTDRLDLTRATGANLSPVWGLSLAHGLTGLLAEPAEPMGTHSADGVEHRVERVTDPDRIAAIAEVIGRDDVLIADGHHRYGVARQYRDHVRAVIRRNDTPAEDTLAFVGELVSEQLAIAAIHRVVRGLPYEQVCRVLGRDFELSPAPSPTPGTLAEMVETGRLVLLAPDGSASWLTPRPGAFDGVRDLDGAWLEHTLAEPLAAGTLALDYQHGLDEVQGLVTGDETVSAAVVIRPTGIAEIERTARESLLMPPKSTFFTPKLRTGFVIRPLTG